MSVKYSNIVNAIVLLGAMAFFSCKRSSTSDDFWKSPLIPEDFPEAFYPVDFDTVSQAEIQLGRELFYDPILSIDSTLSCASCHEQSSAFSDPGLAISPGVNGELGMRNTPTITNLAWHPSYMADGGIAHLNLVPIAPITTFFEMNSSLVSTMERLNASGYKNSFMSTYGVEEIRTKELMKALTAFQLTLISDQSKWDAVQRGTAEFSTEELQGEELFMANCASCHVPPLFSDFTFANNGIDSVFIDQGRGRVTGQAEDIGKFKVPSLRNVTLTFPYMHDGRYETLDEVLDHYGGVDYAEKTDDRVVQIGTLSSEEKGYLTAFLRTLTDNEIISNTRLSNPHE